MDSKWIFELPDGLPGLSEQSLSYILLKFSKQQDRSPFDFHGTDANRE